MIVKKYRRRQQVLLMINAMGTTADFGKSGLNRRSDTMNALKRSATTNAMPPATAMNRKNQLLTREGEMLKIEDIEDDENY